MFNSGTPVEFPEQLMRSSLGQLVNIGDLYDARTDRFTGHSIITTSSEPLAVNAIRTESFQDESVTDATYYDRRALLVNEKEQQLSVILGLVVPEISIGTLIGHDDINMSLKNGVLMRTVTTLHEQIDDVTDVKRLLSSYDGWIGDTATHVVVAIVWGATVAVCFDHNDTGVPFEQPDSDNLQQQSSTLMSILKSGVSPDSQLLSDMNSMYKIRCFSNGLLQENQLHRSSLEEAISLLSDFPRLTQSVNNGKGTPLSFILMPLSLLTECSTAVLSGVDESILNQALILFRDVQLSKHIFVNLFQFLESRRKYLQEEEIGKIDKFFTGFQQHEKTLYSDVGSAVVALRSGRLDQSQIVDTLHAFSHGCYSGENLQTFFDAMEPTLQKIEFIDKLIRQEIVIVGNSQTALCDITCNSDVYILYATESTKHQHPQSWKENSCTFLDIVRQEKRKYGGTSGNSNMATLAYVDCDIVCGANVDEKIAIFRYKQGQVVSNNVAEERAIIASLNIAESSQEMQRVTPKPAAKRAVVELACPGASQRCDSDKRIWSCHICKEQIEYGFDDYFYCSCGKAPVDTFSYKCNGSYHGDDFLEFQPEVVKEHMENIKPIRELNILFFGETGVGKSTWINGFANYISYSTLSEAENSDNVCLIPTRFTMTNENYEEVPIITGTDQNEDQQVGRSSTQMPKSYVFQRGRMHVRIIDTPGIGVTGGIDQDRKNFQNIMTHLSNLDEINGICVLLKPNNSRLSVMFSFCIKELLTHLHRDACKNIVFCFTNARGTFYKPGDTLPGLRELISSSNYSDLRLCKETVYCIDNESVRFLAALKQGVKFDEEEKKNYSTSWEISVKETERLINYISSLPPHRVKNTLSLNDARRLIVALSRPLAEITSTIQNNIGVAHQRRREVMESIKHEQDLTNKLYIPAVDLQTKPLDYPRTVCTAASCVKHISVGGVQKTDYVRHCHPHCYLTGVNKNIVNCVELQSCAAMDDSHHCTHCGCNWSVHMHITYECAQVQTQVVDENVERQIRENATEMETNKQHLKSLEDRINSLEYEKHHVAEVSAKFVCFLKHNAIAPFNDAMFDYLEHLIEIERGKVSAGGDRDHLTGLENMKSMYEEEVAMLEKAIKDPTSQESLPTVETINKLYDDLCSMQITGPMLKDTMKVAEIADAGAMQYNERRVQPYRNPARSSYSTAVSQSPRDKGGIINNFYNHYRNIKI